MNQTEVATKLMNGCGTMITIGLSYSHCGFQNRCFCDLCKAIIKAKRECWQEELFHFKELLFNQEECYACEHSNLVKNRIIEDLKQALKITESVK